MHNEFPSPSSPIPIGFSSVIDEAAELALDLNRLCIKHPNATFFVRVKGDSMERAGIYSNDILIVDRAVTPTSGRVVVAVFNGEFIVRRLRLDESAQFLVAENPHYSPIQIKKESDFSIWGVVTYVLHQL